MPEPEQVRVSPHSPVTAGDVLTLEELRQFQRPSTLRGAGLVLHAWATIAAAMIVYALWPSALTFCVAVAVVGSRQLGLAVLMHETAHWLLFARAHLNPWVGTWMCGGPVGTDFRSYRRQHHLHHRHTQQPDDPDRALAVRFPVTRGTFGRDALADLSGWSACVRLLGWRPWREPAGQWRRGRAPLIGNAVLFGVCAAAGQWYLYPLLWLLPLVTWYRFVTRIRGIAEHAMTVETDDPLRNTRTIGAGLLGRIFMAPYWVNYHLEHHLLLFVPCWKLRRAHALLLAKGYGARMEMAPGYLDVIRRAASLRPA